MPATLQVFRGFPILATILLYQDTAATTPADLTGCTFEAYIGRQEGEALVTLDVTSPDPETGELVIAADAAETLQLTGSLYAWSIVITDATGHPEVIPMGPVNVSTPAGTKEP